MSVKIVEVKLGTSSEAAVAAQKQAAQNENPTESKEYQLERTGKAGEFYARAGEFYMQAGN
jgi:hypothetical protein